MYPYNYPTPNFQPNTQPTSYTPTYSQQLQRVNGLDSAKAYPTQPNSTVALFDANEDIMYIKSTDASNFPLIRCFRFTEVFSDSNKTEQYVTLTEFNEFKEELLNGKQFIQQQSTRKPNGANKTTDELNKTK